MTHPRSKRKQEIIAKVLMGMSAKEIAYELSLSHQTIKWHLTDIYKHFGVKGRHELRAMFGGAK